MLSDRNDATVQFESQNYYIRQLTSADLRPVQIMLSASDSAYHGLAHKARRRPAVRKACPTARSRGG